MRLSKLLAIFAWINTFALFWMQLYDPAIESKWQSTTTLLLFIAVACISSLIQAQDNRYGR